MPNNLTDTEIKKALKICSTKGASCKECPAFVKVDRSNCKQVLLGALNIINRQETLIKKLEKVERYADKTIATQKAEIERLKTECGLAKFDKYKAEFEEFRAEIKAEAYKEVFEKVKNYIDVGHLRKPTEICFSALDVVEMLDNLLNDLVGDGDEKRKD